MTSEDLILKAEKVGSLKEKRPVLAHRMIRCSNFPELGAESIPYNSTVALLDLSCAMCGKLAVKSKSPEYVSRKNPACLCRACLLHVSRIKTIREKAKNNTFRDLGYVKLADNLIGWEYPELKREDVSARARVKGDFFCSVVGCGNRIEKKTAQYMSVNNPECLCDDCLRRVRGEHHSKVMAGKGRSIQDLAQEEGDMAENARKFCKQFIVFPEHPGVTPDQCPRNSKYLARVHCEASDCNEFRERPVHKFIRAKSRSAFLCLDCARTEAAMERIKKEGRENPLVGTPEYERITTGEHGAVPVRCITYPKLSITDVALNSGVSFEWKCLKKGHLFDATVSNRVNRGSNCPYCAGLKPWPGENDLETYCKTHGRVDMMILWPKDVNGPMTDFTYGSGKNVRFHCSVCGDLTQERPLCKFVNALQIMCNGCASAYGNSVQQELFYQLLQRAFRATSAIYKYRTKEFEWLGTSELDMLMQINGRYYAIEYDGKHSDLESVRRDMTKDVLCKDNTVYLIRVRCPECCTYENPAPESVHVLRRQSSHIDADYLHALIETVRVICEMENIDPVKVHMPEMSEMRQLLQEVVVNLKACPEERSIKKKKPTVSKFFDEDFYEGRVRPEHVYASSNLPYHFHHFDGDVEHKWFAVPNRMKEPYECPVCAHKYLQSGVNDFQTLHKDLMSTWNWERNNAAGIFPWDLLGAPGSISVWWDCPVCGEPYQATPNARVYSGLACPKHRHDSARKPVKAEHADGRVLIAGSEAELAGMLGVTSHHVAGSLTSGKMIGGNGQKKPVKCRETGEVFSSIKDAAENAHMEKNRFSRLVKSGSSINGYHYVFEADTGWRISYVDENETPKGKGRPVKDLDTGAIYASMTDAARATGINRSSISTAIKMGRCAGHHHWAYADSLSVSEL